MGLSRVRKPGSRIAVVLSAARRDLHCAWAPAAPRLNLLAVAVPARSSQSVWSHVTASWLCGTGRGQAAPAACAWGASPSCLSAPGGELGTPHSKQYHQQGDAAASATSLRSRGRVAHDAWSGTFTASQNQGCARGAGSDATRGSLAEFYSFHYVLQAFKSSQIDDKSKASSTTLSGINLATAHSP